jgi:hypothetical protein
MNDRILARQQAAQDAMRSLYAAVTVVDDLFNIMHPRKVILRAIDAGEIEADAPWVVAALNCKDDDDIPLIAAEMFMADIKGNYYDMPTPDPTAVS